MDEGGLSKKRKERKDKREKVWKKETLQESEANKKDTRFRKL